MASIRKRAWKTKDGKKTAWVCQYKDRGGTWRIKTFSKNRDADAYRSQVEHEISEGTHVPDRESVSVAEAAAAWLDACKIGRDGRHPVEAHTLRQYDQHVRLHIKPLIGEVRLNTLTTPQVRKFRDDLLKTRSRALAHKVMTSFQSIMIESQGAGLVGRNPARGVTVSMSDRHKKEVAVPSREDIKNILAKADELATQKNKQREKRWRRWRAFVNAATFTGMRASELRGLFWDDVGFDELIIRVRQRADEKGVIGPLKTKNARRDIPIPIHLVTLLKAWKLECPPSDLVFPNWQGNPENLANIFNRCWVPLLERSKLKHFNFHALRHFHASVLIASDANPKEV